MFTLQQSHTKKAETMYSKFYLRALAHEGVLHLEEQLLLIFHLRQSMKQQKFKVTIFPQMREFTIEHQKQEFI